MGYSYDRNNRLCCDLCGRSGGVRKHRCPFNYCPALAACPKCRKERRDLFAKAWHREHGCEKGHAECAARAARENDLLRAGKSVRGSALNTPEYGVHVLFYFLDGTREGYYMAHETYAAIPLGEPATPDDYRKHGDLTPAPPEFSWGSTTKQVACS